MNKTIVWGLAIVLMTVAVMANKPACNPSNACDRIQDILSYLDSHDSGSCSCQVSNTSIQDVWNYIYSHQDSWSSTSTVNNYYNYYTTNQTNQTYTTINNNLFSRGGGLSRQTLGRVIMNDSDYFYVNDNMISVWNDYDARISYCQDYSYMLYNRLVILEKRVLELEKKQGMAKGYSD